MNDALGQIPDDIRQPIPIAINRSFTHHGDDDVARRAFAREGKDDSSDIRASNPRHGCVPPRPVVRVPISERVGESRVVIDSGITRGERSGDGVQDVIVDGGVDRDEGGNADECAKKRTDDAG